MTPQMALMWWKRGKAEQGISASGLCEWLGEGEGREDVPKTLLSWAALS